MGIKDFHHGLSQLVATALEEGVFVDELYGVLCVVKKQTEIALELAVLEQRKVQENVPD